jgi:hypothetical protein
MFSGGGAQAAGALGEATMGAAAANTPATIPLELSSEDQRLAADLRSRGMSEEEIASILGVQQ